MCMRGGGLLALLRGKHQEREGVICYITSSTERRLAWKTFMMHSGWVGSGA